MVTFMFGGQLQLNFHKRNERNVNDYLPFARVLSSMDHRDTIVSKESL